MTRIRLLPVVVAAVGFLAALKTIGLLTTGHFALTGAAPAAAQQAEPAPSPEASQPSPEVAAPAEQAEAPGPNTVRPTDIGALDERSAGERHILEHLTARRQELDGRAEELDQREVLLQATERRIEQRIAELHALEARIQQMADERETAQSAQVQAVVTVYETMRPRDAAAIFDGMDLNVLVDIAQRMKPKKLAEVVGQMTPSSAQRLTVELAARNDRPALPDVSDLPKIGETVGEPIPNAPPPQ